MQPISLDYHWNIQPSIMFGRGLKALWAASAYLVYHHCLWKGLALYIPASFLLRSQLPRLWGYQPMRAEDALFATAYPISSVSVALLSKTNVAHITADLEKRVFPKTMRNRQYPTSILGKTYWAEDQNFHINDHFTTVSTPISTLDQLSTFASSVTKQPFPPNKPPWHAYFVENFQGGSALVIRSHHAYVDGLGRVNALVHNADPHCPRDFYSLAKPSSLWNQLSKPISLVLLPYALLSGLQKSSVRHPLVGSGNREKTIVLTAPIPLSPHLARAKAVGVTFNDYIVSAALRALSAYTAQYYNSHPSHFTMGMPYSMRGHPTDGQPLPPGNNIAFLMLAMPSSASPLDVNHITKQVKSSPLLIQAKQLAANAVSLLPLSLSQHFIRTLKEEIALTVSSVPCCRAPLSYGGTEIQHLFSLAESVEPVAVTLVSYAGHFTLSWSVDKAVIKHPSVLVQLFNERLKQ